MHLSAPFRGVFTFHGWFCFPDVEVVEIGLVLPFIFVLYYQRFNKSKSMMSFFFFFFCFFFAR
ncbi:hypothetical protein Hanom_Chr14g01320301 [Helianthus anomalus]